jgi:hypothetical protein
MDVAGYRTVRSNSKQCALSVPEHWLPVSIGPVKAYSIARIMDFQRTDLSEPFYSLSVRRLRLADSPALEGEVPLEGIIEAGLGLPPTTPAGMITHMTRCGSTLLLNGLKAIRGVVGVGEAEPFGTAFRFQLAKARYWQNVGQSLSASLAALFSHYKGEVSKVIVKGNIRSVLALPFIRALWPNMPCVIIIRNPVEVLVSNVKRPAAWLSGWCQSQALSPFGAIPVSVRDEGVSGYAAWMIGRFCRSALLGLDRNCLVIDYEDITDSLICDIATWFGLSPTVDDIVRIKTVMQYHSKAMDLPFDDDRHAKLQAASPTAVLNVQRWALDPYNELLVRRNPEILRSRRSPDPSPQDCAVSRL